MQMPENLIFYDTQEKAVCSILEITAVDGKTILFW
jgi:hypothetical protein